MASWLLGEKRSGGASVSSSKGMPVLNETYHYTIQTDDKNATRVEILDTPNFPRVNVTLSAGGIARCVGADVIRRESNPLIWDGTATFSSEVDEGSDNQDPSSDPAAWIPVYETKFERLQEVVTKDRSGNAIANSAGQPYQTGLTITRHIPVWEFFQFESAAITDEEIIDRNETVNDEEFKGRAINSLLLCVISSRIGFYYGQRRRLTQYALKYNKKLWTHKRLDVGTIYIQSSQKKPYLDDDGRTVILGALDGSGGKQPAGIAPAVRSFDIYQSISFSFLRV